MTSIVLSIGDELTLGQTVDTNSAWISQQLAAVGCEIVAHVTVPDDQALIERAIEKSAARCDFLIITGGIGPTPDDLTRQALAKVMGVELEINEIWLDHLTNFFRARGREMPEMNKIQAMIPRGAKMIENTCGTAAGMHVVIGASGEGQGAREEKDAEVGDRQGQGARGEGRGAREEKGSDVGDRQRERKVFSRPSPLTPRPCSIFVMPGVPREMKAMFTLAVLPHIRSANGGAVILSRTLHTFGLGESWIAEKLGALMERDRNPSVGTTVSQGIVSLRVNSRFESIEIAREKLDETVGACCAALGDLIFGADGKTLPQVVAESLVSSRLTITTAESCTGGLLAKMLTDIPGSSAYFHAGFVTYSNDVKHRLIDVPIELIQEHGAVSEAVVQAMALGAKDRAGADLALAISGVAGPGGGTAAKPVGTVCIALAHTDGVSIRTFNFPGDREMIRDRSAKMALTMLRFHLLGKELPF